jgi:hypothetical protein
MGTKQFPEDDNLANEDVDNSFDVPDLNGIRGWNCVCKCSNT